MGRPGSFVPLDEHADELPADGFSLDPERFLCWQDEDEKAGLSGFSPERTRFPVGLPGTNEPSRLEREFVREEGRRSVQAGKAVPNALFPLSLEFPTLTWDGNFRCGASLGGSPFFVLGAFAFVWTIDSWLSAKQAALARRPAGAASFLSLYLQIACSSDSV